MCGIAGFLDTRAEQSAQDMHRQIDAMCAVLTHRGPDGQGIWVDARAGAAFGHRRLSIVDLSEAGRQPAISSCGRYVLVTNGEIYNFHALRDELTAQGTIFRGHCDTEVMVEAISRWGVATAVGKFDGMFAFALWDRQNRLLHLGRDRIGEKPLYYGWSGGLFFFASELKALRCHRRFEAELDRDAILLFLRYACIPAPYSIYRGVRKLMPGTIATLAAGRQNADVTETAYWSCKLVAEQGQAEPFQGSREEATEQLAHLLESSIRLRLQADVPVGAFLSGGYDSSIIVSLMRRVIGGRVKTFALGFEEESEAKFARGVARHLETEHVEGHVTAADALNLLPQLTRLYDEPFADSSQIPTYLVSKLARQSVSVSLTGDGGDELFCGYDRYEPVRPKRLTESEFIRGFRAEISQWTLPAFNGPRDVLAPLARPERVLLTPDLCHQMMYMDTISYLPDDLLVKLDRAAMAVSLETRVPFLDHKIVEFAWRLPLSLKLAGDERKWILRQVLYQYVPPALVDRPKQGFMVPLKSWLLGPLREWAEGIVYGAGVRQSGILDPAAVQELWGLFPEGQGRIKHAVWAVLMLQQWLEDYRKPNWMETTGLWTREAAL
jgi:asparagine synthase (glutamine-hydrolysing)